MKPIVTLLAVTLLLIGCSEDKPEPTAQVETIDQSSETEPATASTQTTESQPEEQNQTAAEPTPVSEDIFTVDSNSITLTGTGLSRNGILNQLIDYDEAELIGGPLIDQPVDVNVQSGTMGEVLGQLLDSVDYQARFQKQPEGRATLATLWLGADAMKPEVIVQQISSDGSVTLANPLVPGDGSLDAGEDYVKVISQQYQDGDEEEKKVAIMDVELTEGGVAFLSNVMQTAQDEEVLIEAIRRLEIGEEFGAKWALLESLNHNNPVIVLEILESIEVWRDPTIKKYIQPLTFHTNNDVKEKALELVDDLNTYAEIGIAADPYGVEAASRPVLTQQQIEQTELRQKEKRKKHELNKSSNDKKRKQKAATSTEG